MPRGGSRGKKNYKGRGKQFTNETQLQAEIEKEEKAKAWRRKKGIESSDDEEEEAAAAAAAKAPAATGAPGELPPSESDSDESSSEDEDGEPKHKGVEHLIEVENPNRVAGRQTKKVSELVTDGAKPQLSRREREEIEKQQAKERYNKLHLQGKTEEARTDLARLALIKQQRAEAALKRDQEKLAKEEKEKKKKEK